MTVAAICLGLTAIKYALDEPADGSRPLALMLLVLAAILDALDGRIARVLNATSRMGEEIDSLADAINFGVAPAFIVYASAAERHRGWAGSSCCCTRSASCCGWRDSTRCSTSDLPAYAKHYFVGMPAPAGAIGAIGPLAAKMQFGDGWWTSGGRCRSG